MSLLAAAAHHPHDPPRRRRRDPTSPPPAAAQLLALPYVVRRLRIFFSTRAPSATADVRRAIQDRSTTASRRVEDVWTNNACPNLIFFFASI